MDAQIGRLLEALEEKSALENTVVVFFSDHSIFLGNHGRMSEGTLFEETLNVSMIVSFPKRFPSHQINSHPMEMIDLVPTTFELAGVNQPNAVAKSGFSIVPLLDGKPSNGRKYAFSEILDAQSATDGRSRFIRCDEREFLYDHDTDPWEMKNAVDKLPDVAARLRRSIRQ